jgi:hypothetical protein
MHTTSGYRFPTTRMLAVLSLATLAGCAGLDLGDVPFFCNQGDPMCPDGYRCVANRCVRKGGGTQDGGMVPAEGGITTDWPSYWPADAQPQQPDTPAVKWDLGALPDTSPPQIDSGSSYPSCVTDSDCNVDPLYPCCCLGVCEPFCIFTLCF